MNRFRGNHIERRAGKLSAVQRVRHILLVQKLPSGVVHQKRAVFHLRDCLAANKLRVVLCQRAVQADDIRLAQQRVEIHIRADSAPFVTFVRAVRQNAHAERGSNSAGRLTDSAEADDADGLAGKLDHGIVPVAPVGVICPASGVYRFAVVPDVVAKLQKQRDGKLADRRRAVCRHVADRNAFFLCAGAVDDIVARGKHADEF